MVDLTLVLVYVCCISCVCTRDLGQCMRFLVHISEKPPFNAKDDVSSGSRGLNCGPSLHRHLYFDNESSE